MGYYHKPPEYGGLSQREYRKLTHSSNLAILEGAIKSYSAHQVYLAQMRIANAALRLSGGEITPELKEQVLDALRACGLDVNTRPVWPKKS
jgi:hypothetical protein